MRGIPFRLPNYLSLFYDPGPQPYNPGQSEYPWGGHMGMQFSAQPWPNVVATVGALANNSGTARMRAGLPVVNRYAPLPEDYMFINGFSGKSKG